MVITCIASLTIRKQGITHSCIPVKTKYIKFKYNSENYKTPGGKTGQRTYALYESYWFDSQSK